MSNDHDSEDVGYGKPPRRTRFSSENQPRRKPSKPVRLDRNVLGFLAAGLNERVQITAGGKRMRISKAEFMARSLLKDAVSGTFEQKLKAMQMFDKHGLLGSFQHEEETISDLQEELRALRQTNKDLRVLSEAAIALSWITKAEAVELFSIVQAAQSNCTCKALHECDDALSAIAEWRSELSAKMAEEALEPAGWKSEDLLLAQLQQEQAQWLAQQKPPPGDTAGPQTGNDDDFYSGMLGND